MKGSREWLHTSPHGTAKERFLRLGRLFAGTAGAQPAPNGANDDALAAPLPQQRIGNGGLDTANHDSENHDDLAEFFRNVAAGAYAHDLGDESLYLAEELAGLHRAEEGRQKRALALLVLATMISVRQGSSRLPLGQSASSYLGKLVGSLLSAGKLDLDVQAVLREIEALTRPKALEPAAEASGAAAALGKREIIGQRGEYRPLIVDGGYVYQHRMLWCENQLAARLRASIEAGRASADGQSGHGGAENAESSKTGEAAQIAARVEAALVDVLARPAMAGGAAIALSDEQIHAVRQAVRQRLTVISGGPGTGKTAIVVTMLRVLRRLGEPVESIALAAPTGKAANRMWSSIRRGLEAVAERDALDDELMAEGVEPKTLHRLLGYVPVQDRFRHHENNPLPVTTVIVDEASMIDLLLMERLMRSVPPNARVVLLGDADQLPSVDAGAVLRDLVLAGQAGNRPGSGFAVRLTHSYRMDPKDPAGRAILTAAGEVNAGNADALFADTNSPGRIAVRERPSELAYHGVELMHTGADVSPVHELVDHWYKHRICAQDDFKRLSTRLYYIRNGEWPEEDVADLHKLFACYERSRLLTVTRRQATGSEAINRRLHKRVLADASVDYNPDFYPGEPVMMRRNDYERGLFNGDQGMIVRVSEDGGPQHFRVVFPRGGSYAVFHLDALRTQIELAFAMTVHKSQGSEFDEIALLLPLEEIPLLTREMLYTAITRARRSVVLVGTEELVRAAVDMPGQRFSGLADKLMDVG